MMNQRGQTTQEAAIVISMAIVAAVAMSTFVRRTLQSRMHQAARWESESAAGGNNVPMQYEPYYKESPVASQPVSFNPTRSYSGSNYVVTPTTATGTSTTNTIRQAGGFDLEFPPR